jgi:hypothetical protein
MGCAAKSNQIESEAMEWQPIETAPKDGDSILAFGLQGWDGNYKDYNNQVVYQVVYWREDMEWWQVDTCSFYCETLKATHWMPLPKPPVSIT